MKSGFAEIEAAIAYIHSNLYDPLPLERLAGYVGYSPYHFARLFKERTGLPPLYYVSSVRLERAKHLLLHTDWGVRDIGLEIGQQSLGTFTTRFTERVGMSPSQFRQSAKSAGGQLNRLRTLEKWNDPFSAQWEHQAVTGTVTSERPFQGIILLGLFPKPIPEGLPLYGTLLPGVGRFELGNVAPGVYYLMATSLSWGMGSLDIMLPQSTLRARLPEPIVVTRGQPTPHLNVALREPALDDPPILISLQVLMNRFMNRLEGGSDGIKQL